MNDQDGGFLSRWSQRKARVREGQPVPETPTPAVAEAQGGVAQPPANVLIPLVPPGVPTPAPPEEDTQSPDAAPLTLDDVALLTRDSDFSRFVAPNVDAGVRNAALHKLFSDPHFNVMDGLDTYIDDYNTPDPLPPGMLRRMIQSEALGLFKTEPDAGAAPALTESQAPDEDPDLRLQPHDAAGPEGAEPGAGEDPAGQR
jgi:hypothetical protein